MSNAPQAVTLNVGGEEVKAAFVHVLNASKKPDSILLRKAFFGADAEILEKASSQPDIDTRYTTLISGANCEDPPVPMEKLRELYRSSAVHAACCDAKVSYIAGQGYRVRPRAELFPRMDDWKPNRGSKTPNTKKQNAILDFLEIPQSEGTSFTSLLQAMWLDAEVMGQGYIELSRSGDASINGMYPVKGETILIAKGGRKNGFWQKRGMDVQFYAPYTGKATHKFAEFNKAEVELFDKKHVIHKGSLITPSLEDGLTLINKAASPISQSYSGGKAKVNELLMFAKATPYDTSYGESDIVKGYDDYMIARSIRRYDQSYFDNSTTPRIVILVEGDTTFSQALVNQIERFLESRGGIDALQQSLILQVPNDCRVRIEPMKMAQIDDSDALIMLREKSEGYVKLAHRTPDAVLPGAGSTDAAAIRTFTASVVRPAQTMIENTFNWVFKSELGIDDWVLHLQVPSVEDEKTQMEVWDIALRRGILSINDVRLSLNMPPVDGGSSNFVMIPGQGAVVISKLEEMASRISQGAKVADLMATGDTKTPEKGVRPLEVGKTSLSSMTEDKHKAVAFLVDPGVSFPDMPIEEKEAIRGVLEKMVLNVDDIPKVLDNETY